MTAKAGTVARALEVARKELGYQEGRSGGHWNNDNKYGRAFKANFQPWCAWFVRWVLARAEVPSGIPTSGSCTRNMVAAKQAGTWVADKTAGRPGDVAIFHSRTGTTPVHTGIVEVRHGPGDWTCIEGNTNDDGSAEGHSVLRMRRKADRIVGFIRPNYAAAEVTMPSIKTVPDGQDALTELGPMQIPRGEWVTLCRFRIDNPKRSYRPYTQIHLSLKQCTGGRPNYTKLRWAREGWGDAKPGELDTTSTNTNTVPSELPDSYQHMHNTEIDGGGVLAVQVYVNGSGKAFAPLVVAKVK